MSRHGWILAALALLAAPLAPALAGKPQPPPPAPRLTALVQLAAGFTGCNTDVIAGDDAGRVYIGGFCNAASGYTIAVQCPSAVTSLALGQVQGQLFIGLASGDVYRVINVGASRPWPLEYWGNVFTSAGTGARLPAFPDIAPLEDARPILTGDGAPDTDDAGAPVVK